MPDSTNTTKRSMGTAAAIAVRGIAPFVPIVMAMAFSALTPKLVTPPVGSPPVATVTSQSGTTLVVDGTVPLPLLSKGHPVDWWFVFKFNAKSFPGCGGGTRACPFDLVPPNGTPQAYPEGFGQQYVYASSENPTLVKGASLCTGTTTSAAGTTRPPAQDPLGVTFDEVYHGGFNYIVWNDQMKGDPVMACGGTQCGAPWGHSKGMVAWNSNGDGFVMQVSTPSWPGAGSAAFPRKTNGNTLGCVNDDDVLVSQHFFALRLTHDDLKVVLAGLANASVVTDMGNKQLANVTNASPLDLAPLLSQLGVESKSTALAGGPLSTGVQLLSKPSDLNVPPWQMVSAKLGGVGLRTATWWANPQIPSTTAASTLNCWPTDGSLGKPGPVQIATSGTWNHVVFGLQGGLGGDHNHSKLGVSTSGAAPLVIFGDENQQGALTKDLTKAGCGSSQNGRGGMFYVLNNATLASQVSALLAGQTAETEEGTCPGGGTCTPWTKPTNEMSEDTP